MIYSLDLCQIRITTSVRTRMQLHGKVISFCTAVAGYSAWQILKMSVEPKKKADVDRNCGVRPSNVHVLCSDIIHTFAAGTFHQLIRQLLCMAYGGPKFVLICSLLTVWHDRVNSRLHELTKITHSPWKKIYTKKVPFPLHLYSQIPKL